MAERPPIALNTGWSFMERGIHKLKRILENENEAQFTAQHYMNLYTTIYNMCTQKPPHDYSAELYARYGNAFSAYIADRVLPALRGHSGEFLLSELWTRWSNHKLMVRWLSRFFNYLDRYYIARHTMHSLPEVGLLRFRDEVYAKVRQPAREALLAAVAAERAGEGSNRPLLKNVLSIFIEVGMGSMDCYQRDFEVGLVEATKEHYARVAAAWVEGDSCPEYMAKAEAALRSEEERVDAYLHASSRPRLMAAAEVALLASHAEALLGKEGSGVSSLLRDGRRDDLARMYRLFVRVPRGLDPVAAAFRVHVEGEGNALLRRAEDAAAARREKAEAAAAAAGAAAASASSSAAEKAAEKTAGAAAEHQFVRDAVALHDKYLSFVAECFQNSSHFHKALKEAFEAFCNKSVGGSQLSELMANYCDALLRKGSSGVGAAAAAAGGGGTAAGASGRRGGGGGAAAAAAAKAAADAADGEAPSPGAGASAAAAAAAEAAAAAASDATAAGEDNVDLALEKVIELLPYVSEKDLFSEFYKKKLGRRLLFGSGASNDDAERSVLARLKQQCGSQFTSKMEGMLTDLTLAREKQNQFDDWRKGRAARLGARAPAAGAAPPPPPPVDLSVTVLTTGFWPKYPSFDLQLPAELEAGVAAFSEFYETANLHRKLTWQYTIGSCHLRGNFGPRPLELVLATTQAAALMMFNDAPQETLGYSELRERLRMPDEDAQRVLASLSVLKHRVLLKRDGSGAGSSAAAAASAKASRKISPTDVFVVNAAFTDRMRRVKIPLPQVSSEEKRKVVEDVARDRCNAIDAAIVRVMKARKRLSHRELLLEVTPQLARLFQPDPKVIKKQIESLIEREYLERDPTAATVYKYLA